jgi:hypothetical protein
MQGRTCVLAGVVTLLIVGCAAAQDDGPTRPLALTLVREMRGQQLDFFAAQHPQRAGRYVGVMRFGTSQLSVVSDQVESPGLMEARLAQHDYEGIYRALTTPSRWDEHFLVHDLGGLGLRAERRRGDAFDIVCQSGVHISLDGDWTTQRMTSDQYHHVFRHAERLYADALQVLVAGVGARRAASMTRASSFLPQSDPSRTEWTTCLAPGFWVSWMSHQRWTDGCRRRDVTRHRQSWSADIGCEDVDPAAVCGIVEHFVADAGRQRQYEAIDRQLLTRLDARMLASRGAHED